MRDRVLVRSGLLLLLIGASCLVHAAPNDDLVFDQDEKVALEEGPLIETHHEQSWFHRIKRGLFDSWFNTKSTTTTTTPPPLVGAEEKEEVEVEPEAANLVKANASSQTWQSAESINAKETAPSSERLVRDSREEDEELDEADNEVGEAAEGHRVAAVYGGSDDEDVAGSGEIEGSASETDLNHPVIHDSRKIVGKARFYRITLTVGEPYRREYSDRTSHEYKDLSGNLTHALEELYNRHVPDYKHFASVVKISPTSDAFTSQVTVDLGSTFTDETEVRDILEQQLQYHSLGSIQVAPEGFSFRIFQAGEEAGEQECDQSTELQCRNGACIPLESRCDGIAQCEDGSDEYDCPVYGSVTQGTVNETTRIPTDSEEEDRTEEYEEHTERPAANKCRADDTVRCQDGSRYICSVQRCDGVPDCDDAGDEAGCPHPGCSAGEFACDVSRCILDSQRCNFINDCQDGSDEYDCNYPVCTSSQYQCRNQQCIEGSKRCDGEDDCYDGSDELNCPCRVDQFECTSGYCVAASKRCDGYMDCSNGADEHDCTSMTRCRTDEFECNDGTCVSKSARCNGRQDCPDYSDEYNCTVTTCSGDQFRCVDGTCLSIDKRCNGVADCRNGEDETQCECPNGQLPCDNGVCIDAKFFCDSTVDCRDGSDERDCPDTGDPHPYPPECRADEFRCTNGYCIPRSAVCDGRADCPHDDDEKNCPRVPTTTPGRVHPTQYRCRPDQFKCESDSWCIPHSGVCNGIPECRDHSDEKNCGDAEGLNLKTYPSEQIIKESREVVFQCRDEGPSRARVHWLRGNNLPLPPGSRDLNGRLEIPNIQLEHAGTYICEAVGYPPFTPGAQKAVNLTVEKYEHPGTNLPHVCQYDEATCSNGDCIPKSYVCNERIDCTDGSDEMRCSLHGCEPNQFRCNSKECIHKVWRCDGERDCVDGSDEEDCEVANPGSPCKSTQFQCNNNECISKSYHCDLEKDCSDGSDEIGCSKIYITVPPKPMVVLDEGQELTLTCTAIGVPMPEISWRLNWGHVPTKCSSTSLNGTGTLSCPDIQSEDQGAYSCEALNNNGFILAVPDAIVIVRKPPDICPTGKFNSEARSPEECIPCFCFGVTNQCQSANLFTYHILPPFDRYKIMKVEISPEIRLLEEITPLASSITPISHDGLYIHAEDVAEQHLYQSSLIDHTVPYFPLPETYHGNHLKSYGGYLRYKVWYTGYGRPNDAPSVIVSGNGRTLIHRGQQITPGQVTEESIRFFYGEWYLKDGEHEILASREDIMMTLQSIDNVLIKVKYEDSPQLDIRLTNIIMDTADVRNTGLGSASYVEECQCPAGYDGLSCDQCAPGYVRQQSGPWLGQCIIDEPSCPPGYYGDPARNIPCEVCPCPLTNPSNQFARTCHLGSDGQPTCDCPAGYVGRRCEQCAAGYQGNPLVPGDMCVPAGQCDPDGSLNPQPDPRTGQCRCKQYATGLTCNQCKANTFNLAAINQFGCISCFCMGITKNCVSSNWYRNEIRISFTNTNPGYTLVESKNPNAEPIVDGIRLDLVAREIVYSDFPNRANNVVYYWDLPNIFLGDRITSYGGNLKYTVRYVPSPGGQSSRNNAADVELISGNNMNLLYFSRESLEPNTQQTFTVPLFEQHWQRNDGTNADREHLLMALADLRAIRIKATYTTHTQEAALSFVSLDTAEKHNTGKARAAEVEECSCPAGYKGLSCQQCDVGFTRALEGIYLGTCEPCNCNGHSDHCDPETGVCENCAHHTMGDNCEVCETGFDGDATRGTPQDCSRRRPRPEPCRCDPRGSHSDRCIGDRCECKRNVEGPECNRCRPSTFGLSAENIDGCLECYCSGVTNQCHESSLYIQQIPMWVFDSQHDIILTDASRQEIISEGFELNVGMNEIGYRYPPSRSRRLFWSLPSSFTGNKVKSYGGHLNITQHISAHPGAQTHRDQDVLLIGNGITLFWTNPREIQPDMSFSYSVPLKESEWRHQSAQGPRVASRNDLMTVLANLEAILVRASHSDRMTATYISDVSLDTAVERPTGGRRATEIEACRCPTGYLGTSCESCSRGYYRDSTDRSSSFLGSCKRCPCNNNEESCEITRTGSVKCSCLPGFTGEYCNEPVFPDDNSTQVPTISPPRIRVHVQEPEFQIVQTGNTVRYHCTGRSLDNIDTLHIRWDKEGGQLPPGRTVTDVSGLLIIRDVKVSDSGVYVCEVSDGINTAIKKVTLTVGGVNPVPPRIRISPSYLDVVEGDPIEFYCEANGNPPPHLDWIRVHGTMSPEATFYNGVWRLPAVSKGDAGEYKCIARNTVGVEEQSTTLSVRENPNKPPSHGIPPIVTPTEWVGHSGELIQITCTPAGHENVTWSRSGKLPLPYSASQRNGILTISSPVPSDSGDYVCIAVSFRGTETSAIARIMIEERRPTSVEVRPQRQTVSQGATIEVKCITNGKPGTHVYWSKYTEEMSPQSQQIGDTLRIPNARVSDRGIYICHVSGADRTYEASAVIEVEPREAPRLELHPQETQTVVLGGSADLQCRAIAGIPTPELHWSRQDGRQFPHNIKELPGGLLRLSNITINDGGTYICTAMNEVGSTNVVAHIEVHSMPRITVLPRTGIVQVKLGERVRLECSATGHPQPQVSWARHVNGMPLFDAYSKSEATPLSAVYEIFSVSHDDEGSYTCQAANSVGISEERIQIRIEDDNEVYPCRGDMPCPDENMPPHPPDHIPVDYLRIPVGGKIEINCKAHSYSDDQIYIDWRRADHHTLPHGSTVHNNVLIIPVTDKSVAGMYICLGLDTHGSVLFRAKSHVEVIAPPRIEMNPARQVVSVGDSPSIQCTATGDEPMSIEWSALGRDLPSSISQDHGVLRFHSITHEDAGKYVCEARNEAGTARSVAEVVVHEGVYEDRTEIHALQNNIIGRPGSSVRLQCKTNEQATIHWSREGQPLPSNARITDYFLELKYLRPEDSGRYICTTENARGVSSDYINLSIQPAMMPAVSVEVSQDPVNIGDTIQMRCLCTGAHNPHFRWSRIDHSGLPSNAQEYGNILRLMNVGVNDSGTYRCTADTDEGTFEEDFNLVVHGGHNDSPAIETKSAPYESNIEMDCKVDLEGPIKFRWNKLGGLLPNTAQISENKLKLFNVKADDAGTYICTANNDLVNIEVPTVLIVTGVVPNFNQAPESYIALPPLPDSYLKFNIEISFKPESYDGVLLYNSGWNRDGGDFIVLSLVRGYPQFRFDLGSGTAVIRADKPVTLSEWHTIKVQRNRKEGTMLVDGEGPYKGVATGRKQGLDLAEPLYVGGIPNNVTINKYAEVEAGFVGCISRLILGDKEIDLMDDKTDSVGITNCETCAENPCNNGGICQEASTRNGYTCLCRPGYSGKHCDYMGQSCYPGACGEGACVNKETGFDCYCPHGKTGLRCEHSVKVHDPAFHDDKAFLAHETPKALRRLKISLNFNALDETDGILAYCSQSDEGLGDFVALTVKDGRVEYRYDVGSGVALLRSSQPILPGVWNHVTISRDFKEGNLSVNGETAIEGKSPGAARTLTLNTPLYIGGVDRRKISVNKDVAVDQAFRGCITDLEIASVGVDILKSAIDSANIDDCNLVQPNRTKLFNVLTTPPTTPYDSCSSNPCVHGVCANSDSYDYSCTCEYGYVGRNCENVLKQCEVLTPCRNGGTCTDLHRSYKCDCRLGYSGQNCEKLVEITYDVAFRGDGWLELDRSVMTHEEEREVLGFEISTNKTNGLIMWHGQTPNDLNADDYISLAVVDGYVEYQYNLGSGPAVIRVTAQKVDNGERHRIILKRQGSDGSIELNGEHTESGVSDGLQQILNTRGSVYLGGVPDYAMTFGRYQEGFSGCIYTMEVQDSGAIDIGEKAIRGINVSPCTSGSYDRPPTRGDLGPV